MPTSRQTDCRRPRRRRSSSLAPMLLSLSLAGLAALAVYRWGESILVLDDGRTYAATALVVDESAAAGATTPIVGVAADPRQAAEMAESLARDYVNTRLSQWRRESEAILQAARLQVAQTRDEYAAAMARLTAWKRHMTLEVQAAARRAVAESAEKNAPATVENPRWKELNQQLLERLQALERLSVNRTRLHPAVQEAEDRVAEIRAQLAAEPPQISNPQAKAAAAQPTEKSIWRQVVARATEENRARLDELSAAVERARLACGRAERRENLAWQKSQSPPRLAVRPATVEKNPALAVTDYRRLMWIALAAGTLMALGTMILLRGAAIDPPLRSAAEARAIMRDAAILATIPAETPRPDDAVINRQYVRRRALIAAGTLLMLACPAAAAWCMLAI